MLTASESFGFDPAPAGGRGGAGAALQCGSHAPGNVRTCSRIAPQSSSVPSVAAWMPSLSAQAIRLPSGEKVGLASAYVSAASSASSHRKSVAAPGPAAVNRRRVTRVGRPSLSAASSSSTAIRVPSREATAS